MPGSPMSCVSETTAFPLLRRAHGRAGRDRVLRAVPQHSCLMGCLWAREASVGMVSSVGTVSPETAGTGGSPRTGPSSREREVVKKPGECSLERKQTPTWHGSLPEFRKGPLAGGQWEPCACLSGSVQCGSKPAAFTLCE